MRRLNWMLGATVAALLSATAHAQQQSPVFSPPTMRPNSLQAPAPSATVLNGTEAPAAKPEPNTREANCLPTDRIREAQVVSDRQIRFRMHGGAVYDMTLRDGCFGLAFHESFYYRTSPNRQLCAGVDWITSRSGSRCQIEALRLTPSTKAQR
jgi:hypothetical protein